MDPHEEEKQDDGQRILMLCKREDRNQLNVIKKKVPRGVDFYKQILNM